MFSEGSIHFFIFPGCASAKIYRPLLAKSHHVPGIGRGGGVKEHPQCCAVRLAVDVNLKFHTVAKTSR